MLSEVEALIVLTGFPLLGSIKIRLLVNCFGSARAVLEASPEEIAELPGFGKKIAATWKDWKKDSSWQKNLELVERYKAKIVTYQCLDYPKRLLEIPDPPVLLYIIGELKACDQRSIAVVGTRQSSIYGNEVAEKISIELAQAGFTVISGLARGIDTSAHRGALKYGRTIGVIGSGLANFYPPENAELARHIAKNGAVISEFAMDAAPDRQHFPQRNRIVSGMTLATLLIEAPVKSGAMISVNKALAFGRKVFAIPGRVDNENFKGNHLLIKSGQAQLCESAQDIINSFNDLFEGFNNKIILGKPEVILEKEEKDFFNLLPSHELSVEEIFELTKLPMMKINVLLMGLKLKQVIKEYPGRVYKKLKV